ncbi:MAG: hypothetical protein R3F48_07025 [Candidatus Zixiibacteriota bacterium]
MSLFSRYVRHFLTNNLTLSHSSLLHGFVRQWIKCAGLCLLLSFIMLFAMTAAALVHLSPKESVPSTEAAEHLNAPRLAELFDVCTNTATIGEEVL